MTEKTELESNGNEDSIVRTPPKLPGPALPKPHDRPADLDRRIKRAVESMLEDVQNPYEAVIVAALEARRINEYRLKARSILNQAMEHVEELVPDVPFVPRPVEDEEPEVKPTNEAIEKLALGLVEYEIDDAVKSSPNYFDGEIDFLVEDDESTEG
jgi:DNA-directed RNA polymerase subunit K/omega